MLWITSAPCRATIALQKLSPSHAVRSTPPSRVGAGSRETLGFRDSARSVPIVRAVPSGGAGSSRAFSAPVPSPGAASSLAVGNDLRKTRLSATSPDLSFPSDRHRLFADQESEPVRDEPILSGSFEFAGSRPFKFVWAPPAPTRAVIGRVIGR